MVKRTTRRIAEIDGAENMFEFDHRALHSMTWGFTLDDSSSLQALPTLGRGEAPTTGHEVSQIELSIVLKLRPALPH
jgi:hypothetical protein